MFTLAALSIENRTLLAYEDERLIFGFSQVDFPPAALQRFLAPQPLLFLKQVHSARIVSDREWRPASEADGLILEKPGAVAVIQTADCIPLFFMADDGARGGVIHVGWRGLSLGIETRLLAMLPGDPGKYSFFLGPAIEKKCYPVGEELVGIFSHKPYGAGIFTRRPDGKYLMDIKAGLILSLRSAGIGAGRIQDSGLCTYCLAERFPSFRRDGRTGKRIFNFLALRNG